MVRGSTLKRIATFLTMDSHADRHSTVEVPAIPIADLVGACGIIEVRGEDGLVPCLARV